MKATEVGTSKSEKIYGKVIWEGEVVDVLDGEENGVIRVRIPELDKNLSNENLPYCYPLFNFSFFRALPKQGERVTLMFRNIYNTTDSNSKDIRYWISVVHSNIYSTDFQPFLFESNAHYADGLIKKPKKTSGIIESKGIYPSKEDISINGRNNSTIYLQKNQLLLRAGGHEENDALKFNKKNPAFLLIKHPNENKKEAEVKSSKKSIFVEPKHQIIAQLNNDTKGNIQIKDKLKDKVLSTQVVTKTTRPEVILAMKNEILRLENNFPYWELLNFVPELDNLPKVYSLENQEESSEETTLVEKSLNFSTSVLASDKIFLISHLNNEFNVRKQPELISDQDFISLSESAHPIPYGDRLIEFLDLFRKVMANHVHPYNAMKTVPEEMVLKLLNFDLQKLLNKNVFTG
jgi:hypothetical protein